MTAWAAQFKISNASTHLNNGVYLLSADIHFELTTTVLDALNNSVPLTISIQMQVRRQRALLWDETIANLQQSFSLHYHALAQQYVVTNKNSDEIHSFPTRSTATRFIGRIRNFPLLDQSLLPASDDYYVSLRAELDIEALPAPLRPLAYLSEDWRLTSEWHSWPL